MQEAKETLFRAVRRGEVLLWVGSGFSYYAGYPLAQQLVQELHTELTPSQQEQLDSSWSLPRYAEAYFELYRGNRHQLTRHLQRIFTRRPTTTHAHEVLAQLPFLDQIVTTNYDNLFELVYAERLHKVTAGKHIPLGEANQIILYKVHGDFQEPDSLVVSDGDFRNFFQKHDRLLWSTLEALMAKRHLVFVGYSLEDPNVRALFEQLWEALGTQMREAYLIAPGFKPLSISWLERHNIRYIDSTGEDFVKELMAETKLHVLADLKQGRVSADRTSQFLDKLGLNFSYSNNEQGLTISQLRKRGGPTEQTLSFKLDASSPSVKNLQNLVAGETLNTVSIPKEAILRAAIEVEGVRLPDNISEFSISPSPAWEKTIDIFCEDGTRFIDVKVKNYNSNEEGIIKVFTLYNSVKITIPLTKIHRAKKNTDFGILIKPNDKIFASVEALTEYIELTRCIGSGVSFTCIEKGIAVWTSERRPVQSDLLEHGQAFSALAEEIKFLETTLCVVFRKFDLTNDDWVNIKDLAKRLRLEPSEYQMKGAAIITLDGSESAEDWQELIDKKAPIGSFCIEQTETVRYSLCKWEFEVIARVTRIIHNAKVLKSKKPHTYEVRSTNKKITVTPTSIHSKIILAQPTIVKSNTHNRVAICC